MLKVYSIRDIKSEGYGSLFTLLSEGLALRSFGEAALDPKTPFSRYPHDFQLFELGTFEETTGRLESLKHPRYIASAAEALTAIRPPAMIQEESTKGEPVLTATGFEFNGGSN
ncbi:MAG: nonstructural protein [Microvirus sp.]|nr:MAG: nonstructural protein [Microvirus sp.]